MVAGASLLVAGSVYARDFQTAVAAPSDGGVAVIYSGQYNPADFEAAKQVMVEGFTEANAAAGQPKGTYWLADPDRNEIISVVFFEMPPLSRPGMSMPNGRRCSSNWNPA